MPRPTLRNFGRNLAFSPQSTVAPRSEEEVLEILSANAATRIRPIGSLHSWSGVPATDGVSVDLRHLNHVRVRRDDATGDHRVRVGAGCTVRHLLREMRGQADLTLPSLGLIQAQTVAGATATGTHGSGNHSMSHYVRAARVATYDSSGQPEIRTVDAGAALQAIRCSLGCLGIITELEFEARPQYRIREVFRVHERIDSVLAAEDEFPIQQFYLVPWSWRYYAQHRIETEEPRSLSAPLYRAYWVTILDLGLHAVIRLLVQTFRSPRGVRAFFKWIAGRLVVRGWSVVDRSDRQLTMNHDWFRHIEIELFVERSHLADAIEFVEGVLRFVAGEECQAKIRAALQRAEGFERAAALRGEYTHHYPICVRKVLPDATLISMASGDAEARYAISLISYGPPNARGPFLEVASLLADSMGELFQARPHWGKVCPMTATRVRRLYPRLDEFLGVRGAFDAENRFGNDWTDQLFGLHR